MYIYCITNTLNGLKYVGLTSKTIEESKEYYGSGRYITRAIKKLGRQYFTKEIIEVCDDLEHLKEREKYWIKALNVKHPFGYNLTDGGDGVLNLCEEGKKRKNEKLKLLVGEKHHHYGKKRNKEWRDNISKGLTGRQLSPEHAEKSRRANLGNTMPSHVKEILIKANTGRVYTQESIDLIRKNQPTCTPILQYTKSKVFIAEYFSINEAERCTGVAKSSICMCCKGKLKSAGKFFWKYGNELNT
jgi:group I intron endonuclease